MTIFKACICCAAPFLLGSTAWAEDHSPVPVAFHIEARSLKSALTQFGEQSGLQILFSKETVEGLSAQGVTGTFTPEAALQQLIAHTGLRYEFVNPHTVRIWNTSTSNDTHGKPVPRAVVTQAATDTASQSVGPAAPEPTSIHSEEKVEKKNDLEEIVVTGTHIHGIQNPTAPVTVYDRDAIDRSGYTSTQDFVASIPQNFRGGSTGASEDGVLAAGNGPYNEESASGVNLRGLGNSSTLVLLNGHRVAPSAYGAAVDVSLFPLNAIDRVEVLTDGASAVYGADAVGGVVNFVLRNDYNGAETNVRYGTTTQGGRDQEILGQTFGHNWSGGNALAAFQYEDDTRLRSDQRDFTASLPQPTDLYPGIKKYSAIFNGRQMLPENIEVSTDVLYNHEQLVRNYQTLDVQSGGQTAAQNSDSDFLSANGAIEWHPIHDWTLGASGLYSQVNTTGVVVFTPPQASYTNGTPYFRDAFSLSEGDVKADGTVLTLPGGALKAALGGSYRKENFTVAVPWAPTNNKQFERSVSSGFAELYAPIIGAGNALPGVRQFDISAAVRYDHYSDFGKTTNPKFGIFWSPADELGVRASYGTSFRAPNAQEEISNAGNLVAFNYPFSSPGGGTVPVLVVSGSSLLRPEQSTDIAVGIDYKPQWLSGLKLSLNYYDISYRDRIVQTPFDPTALLQPNVYGPLITPIPSDAAAAAYLATLISQGFQFTDYTGTGTTGIRDAYTFALTNASRVEQNGFDFGAEYAFQVQENKYSLGLNTAHIDEIKTSFCSSCASTELLNTYGQPLKWRVRGDGSWSRAQWQWNVAINYVNAYSDTTAIPEGHIASWTTVDTNIRWSPVGVPGLTLGLNIINLLNADPPQTAGGIAFTGFHYDAGNANPLGRAISVQVTQKW
jgi:iron complex outermembrane recepter protein